MQCVLYVLTNVYLLVAGERIVRLIFLPSYYSYVKCKLLHQGFELRSPCPFPMMIIIKL